MPKFAIGRKLVQLSRNRTISTSRVRGRKKFTIGIINHKFRNVPAGCRYNNMCIRTCVLLVFSKVARGWFFAIKKHIVGRTADHHEGAALHRP